MCLLRPQVISTSSNLTVIVSPATAGRYRCKASTPGFGEVSAEVAVLMRSAPVIGSPRVQHGTPTDTVRLECVASSVPVADRIVWSYQGTVIGTRNDQNYYSVSIRRGRCREPGRGSGNLKLGVGRGGRI